MKERLRRGMEEIRRFLIPSESGVSLIELAIALGILSLLVGGALQGIALLEKGRLVATLQQGEKYRLATMMYWQNYGRLPGQKANQDHLTGGGLQAGSDALTFWQDLFREGSIENPGSSNSGPGFGQGAPRAKAGGGFTVFYGTVGEGGNARKTHWLVLGGQGGDHGRKGVLTPAQVLKMLGPNGGEDIVPMTGEGASHQCVGPNGLDLSIKEPVCTLYFKLF